VNARDDSRCEDNDDDSDDNNDGNGGNDNHDTAGSEDEEMTEEEMRNIKSAIDAENDKGLTRHQEEKTIEAADHVKAEKCQRQLFNEKIANAREDDENNEPHPSKRRCLVVDYCQLMTLPSFGGVQPGKTYYDSPLKYHTLGCVDPSEEGGDCLYAHLYYHEGQGKKGGNNVALLIVYQLKHLGLIDRSKGTREELTIVFDNCPGQNKNNFVFWLVPYLVEMRYFEEVTFIFLVASHTNNCCDQMFNLLKIQYRKSNIYGTEDLIKVLGINKKVTILEVGDEDFKNFNKYLSDFYKT
jgi:hypothetical protein